jgi:hypothetical protein
MVTDKTDDEIVLWFIKENFDIYRKPSEWGEDFWRYSPKTEIGQLCVEMSERSSRTLPIGFTTIGERPLYHNWNGIMTVLVRFYNIPRERVGELAFKSITNPDFVVNIL